MSDLMRNIWRFALLVLLQVFVLNNVLISGLTVPSIYFLFILLLPFRTPVWAQLILAFLLGVTIDMFMNTGGLNSAACVFIAFLRPAVIKIFVSEDNLDPIEITPSVKTMRWLPFMVYASSLTLIYHTVYYLLEIFAFNDIFYLVIKILISTLLSMSMIIVWELFLRTSRVRAKG